MAVDEKLMFALDIAKSAHEGQVDKGGKPYILHPVRVSELVSTEEERIVALLHDVVEDCGVDIDKLRAIFGDRVAEAIEAVTHRKEEPYFDYIRRVMKNPIATAVKKADLIHNMNLDRLSAVGPNEIKRFEKYVKAYSMLMGGVDAS